MATTNFVNGTVIQPSWLNPVDSASYPYLASVTGTNTITAVGPTSYAAYAQQAGFILMPQVSNTGPVTININGLGAKAITKYGSTALVANDLLVGAIAYIVYDGTRFQLLNPQTVAARITGRLLNVQAFNANGTHTATAGTTKIVVKAWGGGGGGAGSTATAAGQASVGGGGAGGMYVESYLTYSGPASVTIGAGGTGNLGAGGGNGGNTIYGASLVVAAGGLGGITAAAGPAVVGAAGGIVAGGSVFNTLSISSAGRAGFGVGSLSLGVGGEGGGGAGSSITVSGGGANNGIAASAPGGGGGGGASANGAGATTGGVGGAGYLVVYEYA